jgi:2-succinyl-5-enolpyruvyl-6-hydroxy-3-cyclohexene-1-carboxylate synthase
MLGNRGVNGIDGFVSTVLGGAQVADGPVVALLGDLCFLHDSNGLIGASTRGINATLVVVDNDGGGIFSFLPPAQALPASDFETLFSTPTGVDIVDLCAVHGIAAESVTEAAELTDTLGRAVATPGVSVIVVRVDRTTNVARHQAVWEAVAAATKI